jgi:molecular chaperone DnaK
VSGSDAGESKLLPLRIRLPFTSEEQFVERYGANVDRQSLFIATRSTKPEGTAISFELVLQDGARLMRGEGVVSQVNVSEAPGQSGMRVRFTRLEARTKTLVDQIAAAREAKELKPQPSPVPPPAPEPIIAEVPPAPAPAPSAPHPAPTAQTDQVIGIDFGTHLCRAAVFQDGKPQLVRFSGESLTLPAVVAVDASGNLVAGAKAATLATSAPERALFGLKRLLGRRARSSRVKEDARRFNFVVSADTEGEVQCELGGKVFPVRALAAALLLEVQRAASLQLSAQVRRVVIGVPAWFTHRQRRALLSAAKDAGLEVTQLISEPSAVALAFGHGRGLARKRLLVYDFGGGTFDAAVVEATGDDLEVVSVGGDDALGGLDFDVAATEALERELPPDARRALAETPRLRLTLRQSISAARIALSHAAQAAVQIPGLGHKELGRDWLEAQTGALVDHSLALTRAVLESARLTAAGLDEVVVAGSVSQMPQVRARLEAVLGRSQPLVIAEDGAVAIGAAWYGHALELKERGKSGSTVAEVLGAPVGIAVQGGGFRRVLERNTRLPADKTLPVPVTAGQAVQLAVFQGARGLARENDFLGALAAVAEKPGELLVRFSISPDGVLEVKAVGSGGKPARSEWTTAEPDDDTVEKALAAAAMPDEARPDSPSKGIFGGFLRLLGRS